MLAGADEHRLGDDSDHLLHEERGAGEESAAVAAAKTGSASVPRSRSVVPSAPASQAASSIAAQSCSTPPNGVTTAAAHVAVPASTATSHGACSSTTPRSSSGRPLSRSRARIDEDEVDVVLRRKSHGIGSGLGRRKGGHPAGHALLSERVRCPASAALAAARSSSVRRRRARMSSRGGPRASGSATASSAPRRVMSPRRP